MKLLVVIVAVLGCCGPVLAQGKIENPQYKHWASFKPGTRNVSKGEMSRAGVKALIETITTLKEVKRDQLTIEVATTLTIGDHKQSSPPKTQTVLAEYLPDANSITVEKSGTETIDAMGRKITCDVYQIRVPETEGQSNLKLWVNQDIPGAVKTEAKIRNQQTELTRTMVVESVEVK